MKGLFLIIIFLTLNLSSKSQNIQNISPSNLIVSDTMTVDILTSLPFLVGNEPPWYCGELVSIHDTTSNNIITIDLLLDLTGVKSPAACSRIDTVKIALPSIAGNYELKCLLSTIDTINPAYNGVRILRDSISIVVNSVNSLDEKQKNQALEISFIGENNQLAISANSQIDILRIISMLGDVVKESMNTKLVELSNLRSGLYVVVIELESGQVISEKILIP